MKKYILKKILFMIPMLLIISFLVFIALDLTPADPLTYMVSPDMSSSADQIEKLRQQLGLNDPVLVRYGRWLWQILHGDFGYSIVNGNPISKIVGQALPATFELAFVSLIISTIVGILIGVISAVKQNGIIDNIARFLAVIGTAIPQFFFGILILNFFAIQLKILPIGGRFSSGDFTFISRIQHLILPVTAMSIGLVAALMRYTRNSMLDVFNADYVKTARAKGVPEWKVYFKHIFRNAMRPILVLLIFRLPLLIGGSVIIESVFSWPGIGTIIISSVTAGDYPVIMVTTLMISVVVLFASLLVDIMAAVLDPRIRY
ncbi:ABC transporter permease [Granulicatella adiacens]|uniref:ABC transporter permease n=1 Tax=Granulicatella adiacens TaxID=46124 RepID=UPI000B1577A2|nr:MAG: ABC transporter permease [Granulicatella sp.]